MKKRAKQRKLKKAQAHHSSVSDIDRRIRRSLKELDEGKGTVYHNEESFIRSLERK